jgi:hypothetical protein
MDSHYEAPATNPAPQPFWEHAGGLERSLLMRKDLQGEGNYDAARDTRKRSPLTPRIVRR